jgi:acetylornithine deacetylase/succinyl-diaminopimelate desuccinylase-like protein
MSTHPGRPEWSEAVAAADRYLDATRSDRLHELVGFLRIPSVSGVAEATDACEEAAAYVAEALRRAGCPAVEVAPTGGAPVVFGEWGTSGTAPTVLVYSHYDVMPAALSDGWSSPPFDPVVREDILVARGASDDKSQVFMHIWAAQALVHALGVLPVNLRLVIEGEEESSSTHLDAWLSANSGRLSADVAVVSDTPFFDRGVPAITYGLRGLMLAEIEVEGPPTDLHSGYYGGVVANPANTLCRIVTSMQDAVGRISIPGFYEGVIDADEEERAHYAQIATSEAELRDAAGVPCLAGEDGYSALERRTLRPSFDVNGLGSGYQGEGSKTIIPSKASAKLSFRLVPGQVPEQVYERLREHVAQVSPPGVSMSLRYLGGARPILTDRDHPAVMAAAVALADAFGVEPVHARFGGSIPAAAMIDERLGVPVVMVGFSPPGDHAHAPDEWMDREIIERGTRALVRLWLLLGRGAASASGDSRKR